jgi:cytochrome c oxidase subunit 4
MESNLLSPSELEQEHATEAHAPYLKVWAALAVFTAIEYFYAFIFKDAFVVLLLGLLLWAVIKAGLVGWFFMHLKFEGAWVYILIVPAFVLAAILVLACTPDMAMKPETEENPGEESSFVSPIRYERAGPFTHHRAHAIIAIGRGAGSAPAVGDSSASA